ncbi:MAG: hypothetical protein CSA79_00715 [Thiothrix nivea]|nr:MAG: hypothetical protein CSA79_00715 [Thiothrix nivea]
MDNKSTTKRMIGAVVLVLIAALLLAWLLKGKNKSVQEQQELIAEQTQGATPILGFPGVKEGESQVAQEGEAPYVIGGTDAQQEDQEGAGTAQQNKGEQAQTAQQPTKDGDGNSVGDKLAGAATAGKEAVKNLAGNFQVHDTDGKQRQVVDGTKVKDGVGSMGSSEIALPKQADSGSGNTGAANQVPQAPSADNGTTQGTDAAANNTQQTHNSSGSHSSGSSGTSQTTQAAPKKQEAVKPRLVGEKPVPAPRSQSSATQSKPAASSRSSHSSASSASSQSSSAPVSGSGYVIQVLAASSHSTAKQVKQSIAVDGYPVFVVKANVNGKTVYRVRVGPYPAKSAARSVQAKMKARYTKNQYVQNSFVTKN